MPTVKDTTLRCLTMLKMIPRAPAAIDVGNIEERLLDQGYQVTRRTIQRDLNKLCIPFPIYCDKSSGTRASNWSWMEGAEVMDIPEMSPLTALTFTLVESFLCQVLPPTFLNYLNPHFRRAKNLLGKLQSTHPYRWAEKIRIISRGQLLIPALVNHETLEIVYKAIISEKQFRAKYRAKDGIMPKEYNVHPQGLVFRNEIIYLVCTLRKYEDIRQLAIHRFESAELLEEPRIAAKNFNLDKYITEGKFSYPTEENLIKIHVLFDPKAAAHLYETPLSEDQSLSEKKDGRIQLNATVKNTSELRWWLLGFGDLVEVLKPKKLRDEFASKVKNLAVMYRAS
jgi:predicted DNA-binding transcriptional regulator YafY